MAFSGPEGVKETKPNEAVHNEDNYLTGSSHGLQGRHGTFECSEVSNGGARPRGFPFFASKSQQISKRPPDHAGQTAVEKIQSVFERAANSKVFNSLNNRGSSSAIAPQGPSSSTPQIPGASYALDDDCEERPTINGEEDAVRCQTPNVSNLVSTGARSKARSKATHRSAATSLAPEPPSSPSVFRKSPERSSQGSSDSPRSQRSSGSQTSALPHSDLMSSPRSSATTDRPVNYGGSGGAIPKASSATASGSAGASSRHLMKGPSSGDSSEWFQGQAVQMRRCLCGRYSEEVTAGSSGRRRGRCKICRSKAKYLPNQHSLDSSGLEGFSRDVGSNREGYGMPRRAASEDRRADDEDDVSLSIQQSAATDFLRPPTTNASARSNPTPSMLPTTPHSSRLSLFSRPSRVPHLHRQERVDKEHESPLQPPASISCGSLAQALPDHGLRTPLGPPPLPPAPSRHQYLHHQCVGSGSPARLLPPPTSLPLRPRVPPLSHSMDAGQQNEFLRSCFQTSSSNSSGFPRIQLENLPDFDVLQDHRGEEVVHGLGPRGAGAHSPRVDHRLHQPSHQHNNVAAAAASSSHQMAEYLSLPAQRTHLNRASTDPTSATVNQATPVSPPPPYEEVLKERREAPPSYEEALSGRTAASRANPRSLSYEEGSAGVHSTPPPPFRSQHLYNQHHRPSLPNSSQRPLGGPAGGTSRQLTRSRAEDIPDIYWEQAARELDFCTCRKCQARYRQYFEEDPDASDVMLPMETQVMMQEVLSDGMAFCSLM